MRPELANDIGHPAPTGRLSGKGFFLTFSQVGEASEVNIHSLINSFDDLLESTSPFFYFLIICNPNLIHL